MNSNSTDTIEARVARGVALLDEKLPGWDRRIDLDKLDLASPCNCVLGQTWDEQSDDPDDPYFLHASRLFGRLDVQEEVAHGFNSTHVLGVEAVSEMNTLTAEWKCVILARREIAS